MSVYMCVTTFLGAKEMKSLEFYIKHEEAQPLSVDRLKTYVRRPHLKFVNIKDITKKTSLAKLCPAGTGICILWSSAKGDIGHFTGLFHTAQGYLYFDPTGLAIHRLSQLTHNPFILQGLLDNGGHVVRYNRFKYQQIRSNVQSCGRHVCCRWNCIDMSDKQYRGIMTHRHLKPDAIATLFTLPNDLAHWKRVMASEK
jgi:hypothetical protein